MGQVLNANNEYGPDSYRDSINDFEVHFTNQHSLFNIRYSHFKESHPCFHKDGRSGFNWFS